LAILAPNGANEEGCTEACCCADTGCSILNASSALRFRESLAIGTLLEPGLRLSVEDLNVKEDDVFVVKGFLRGMRLGCKTCWLDLKDDGGFVMMGFLDALEFCGRLGWVFRVASSFCTGTGIEGPGR